MIRPFADRAKGFDRLRRKASDAISKLVLAKAEKNSPSPTSTSTPIPDIDEVAVWLPSPAETLRAPAPPSATEETDPEPTWDVPADEPAEPLQLVPEPQSNLLALTALLSVCASRRFGTRSPRIGTD